MPMTEFTKAKDGRLRARSTGSTTRRVGVRAVQGGHGRFMEGSRKVMEHGLNNESELEARALAIPHMETRLAIPI